MKDNWRNPPKYMKPSTEGACPYCKKQVQSLEAHIKDKHKKEVARKR